jgi:hypothetical protein
LVRPRPRLALPARESSSSSLRKERPLPALAYPRPVRCSPRPRLSLACPSPRRTPLRPSYRPITQITCLLLPLLWAYAIESLPQKSSGLIPNRFSVLRLRSSASRRRLSCALRFFSRSSRCTAPADIAASCGVANDGAAGVASFLFELTILLPFFDMNAICVSFSNRNSPLISTCMLPLPNALHDTLLTKSDRRLIVARVRGLSATAPPPYSHLTTSPEITHRPPSTGP